MGNFTSTNLAEPREGVSRDVVAEYRMGERLTARALWEFAAGLIANTPEAFRSTAPGSWSW